ncbi:Uncharacterised protein [Mycobacteroides abscessus subsp. abscessus]|nr:Uncharacterised protein [Mycobacteroides abscessus subsp. abscessus]
MPNRPVQILPLAITTAAMARFASAKPAATRCPTVPSEVRKSLISSSDSGWKPSSNRPVTASATKTASTEVRPCSSQ